MEGITYFLNSNLIIFQFLLIFIILFGLTFLNRGFSLFFIMITFIYGLYYFIFLNQEDKEIHKHNIQKIFIIERNIEYDKKSISEKVKEIYDENGKRKVKYEDRTDKSGGWINYITEDIIMKDNEKVD